VGDVSYVAVEGPDGTSELYALGDEVPDLGRVTEITANSATFSRLGNTTTLRLLPAPTPTRAPRRSTSGTSMTLQPPPGHTADR
jgi:hypothetical protein